MLDAIGDMFDAFRDYHNGETRVVKNRDMAGFEEYLKEEMKGFTFHLLQKDGLFGYYEDRVRVVKSEFKQPNTIPDTENFSNIDQYVRDLIDINFNNVKKIKERVFVPYANQEQCQLEYDNALKHYRNCIKHRYENSIGRLIDWDTTTEVVKPGDELGPVAAL